MSTELIEQIANAVLYEGYILYPYRPSSVKNRRRFNFGVLVPPAYSAAMSGTETATMQTECLVWGGPATKVSLRLRFLQILEPGSTPETAWQDAVEREVCINDCQLGDLLAGPRREHFCFSAGPHSIEGSLQLSADCPELGLFAVSGHVVNWTVVDGAHDLSRDQILPYSLVAAHMILNAREGEFISLLDPPDRFREAATRCRNLGVWPVLVGPEGDRSTMLSSPIVLYDYPQVAAESPGDLCDLTEIDEILSLRILTLTDEEKREMRGAGEHARRILERTEGLTQEHWMKLHGAFRGLRPLEESK